MNPFGTSSVSQDGDGVPGRVPTVLVVDPDRVTRRFVELALGDLQVEAVGSAAAVLDHLDAAPTDLILCGSRLSDADGIDLCRRLQRDQRFKVIPFLILSSDQRAATKTAALDAGVSDYIPKPCDPTELAARVRAHIDRARVAQSTPTRPWALAGGLDTLALPDLLGALEYGRHTGLLAVSTATATAQVFLERGRVVHAVYGNITGAPAFHYLMAESGGGQFEFCPSILEPDQRTIDSSIAGLVLESARVYDEMKAGKSESTPTRTGAVARQSSGSFPTPPPPRSAEVVRPLLHGLLDGWQPGELGLVPQTRLKTWSRGGNSLRFHVHLITSVGLGVAGLASLAEPPGEDLLSSALGDEPCALTLTLRLRNDRVIDVLLLDLRNLERWLRPLMRAPSLTIIAPPGGDTLSFGAQVPVGLNRLLEKLPPAFITAVGQPSLQRFVKELSTVKELGIPVHETPGVLGERELTLRRVMDISVRAWGGGGA